MDPNLLPPGASSQVTQIAHITAPMSNEEGAVTKYYICTISFASLHRYDGKKLPFVHGFLETSIKTDIEYLDKEISEGNVYLRYATDEEIHASKMRRDPRGTIANEIREQVESEISAHYDAEIKALQDALASIETSSDEQKLAGIDSARARIDALKAKGKVHKSGTATVIMESVPAPLKGIVNSGNLAGAETGSTSGMSVE